MNAREERFSQSRPRDGEYRTEFQRDRDRVLYSDEFRRLSGVTQVVSAIEGDVFHNRLTHSLKVAQVGRRMAERLLRESPEDLVKACGGIDPDVVETAGLAHDLGHPPFGHGGEDVICRAMCDRGLEEGFEGNPQSFRIVTRLAIRYADQVPPGLDLTRASLNAILKYPWLWEREGGRNRKWGAYAEDSDHFAWARDGAGLGEGSRTVEAELMDWADDITYAVHDMEDFYRAGLIPLERLHAHGSYDHASSPMTPEIERVAEAVRRDESHPDNEADLASDTTELGKQLMSLIDPYFSSLDGPFDGGRQQRDALRAATSFLITKFIDAMSLREPTTENMRMVEIDKAAKAEVSVLKELTKYYVIQHPRVVSIRAGQRRMLAKLFGIYLEAIEGKKDRDLALLPQTIRSRLGSGDSPQRLTADLLAGMTERQVVQTYQRLMGFIPGPISYFDV